jgi:voltage-gated potassium channel
VLPRRAGAAPLTRRSAVPPWASLLLRLLFALGLIGVALAVHWFDRAGLRDNVDGQISFSDVLYFTMITITTVGYGDIVPVTERARLFDAFGLTPIRLFVWLIFLGTAYDLFLRGLLEKGRMTLIQRNLSGHVLVAGYGSSGAEAVAELCRTGVPAAKIVVIDSDPRAIEAAQACGVPVLHDDATRDATLQAARVERCRTVIVCAGRDDTSILIVLTARRLAPRTPISVVIRSSDNEALARQAGADTVINPASFAGLLLAGSTHGPHLADYLADLAGAEGDVALRERPARAEEVGRPLAAIASGAGLRIHRGGRAFGFWEPEAQRLERGDLIIEVAPRTSAGR